MIINAELEVCSGYGWQGAPEFNTLIKQLRSGHERRRPLWDVVKHRYMLPLNNITDAAYLTKVKSVFLAARGAAHSFLVRDESDYIADDAFFGVGTGAETSFPLYIQSVFGSEAYDRRIMYPVNPTFYVNGVAATATFNTSTKQVVFAAPPASGALLTWSGEFRVLVRFASDSLPMTIDNKSANGYAMNGTIELMEVWE